MARAVRWHTSSLHQYVVREKHAACSDPVVPLTEFASCCRSPFSADEGDRPYVRVSACSGSVRYAVAGAVGRELLIVHTSPPGVRHAGAVAMTSHIVLLAMTSHVVLSVSGALDAALPWPRVIEGPISKAT